MAGNRAREAREQLKSAATRGTEGKYDEAIPLYEKALAADILEESELQSALLGLATAYRALGKFRQAVDVLQRGTVLFPENRAIRVFLAVSLHGFGEHDEAVRYLLETLVDTAAHPTLDAHKDAIRFEACQLGRTWQ